MNKILVIYTGGTIGMQTIPGSDSLEVAPLSQLLAHPVCGVRVGNTQTRVQLDRALLVDWLSLAEPVDSADLTTTHWQQLILLITRHYGRYDGFVLLHGTDSMAYTASALSFALTGLDKPVVLTGSQLPLSQQHSDAPANILGALRVACVQLHQVVIAFAGRVIRGNRARKVHANDCDAFTSPNYPVLAVFDDRGVSLADLPDDLPAAIGFSPTDTFSSKVVNLFFTPGMDVQLLCESLNTVVVDGYVLHGLGTGNLPASPDIHRAIANARGRGAQLLALTQCYQGTTRTITYPTGAALQRYGVLEGGDMTPEAATTKLMWALANLQATQIPDYMITSQCGERTALSD